MKARRTRQKWTSAPEQRILVTLRLSACRLSGLVLLLLVGAMPLCAQPQVPPPSGKWVTDTAGMLTQPEQEMLSVKLRGFADSTSNQIIVVLVPDLGGADPADYALEIGRTWQVGQADFNNGVVVLVSRDDRKVQIATGYGLEGAIPDVTAGRIIRNIITPNFREGRYFNGLNEATDALMLAAQGEYSAEDVPGGTDAQGVDMASLLILFIIVFFVFRALRHRGGGPGGGRRYRSSFGGPPVIIWGGGGFGGGGGGFGGGGFGGGGFGGGGGGFGGGGAGGGW